MKKCILILILLYATACDNDSGSSSSNTDYCAEKSSLPQGNYAIIGDSIFDQNKTGCYDIGSRLSILLGEQVADYAEAGAYMDGGSTATDVSDQYQSLHAALDSEGRTLDVLIVNGGGNDVLNSFCILDINGCEALCDETFDEGMALLGQAINNDCINNIIYMGYYELMSPFSVYNNDLNEMMDNIENQSNTTGDFIFLDLRDSFTSASYYKNDGLHPTTAGSAHIAERLYDVINGL